MTTLPCNVRTVKTPVIEPDDDEPRRTPIAAKHGPRSSGRWSSLADVTNPDVLESADNALYNALFDLVHGKAWRHS